MDEMHSHLSDIPAVHCVFAFLPATIRRMTRLQTFRIANDRFKLMVALALLSVSVGATLAA
ncbi:MAG TPA: hypothetical protein VK327_11040, partial [Candidatus Paceibacterota bacterium]|nr:hypothetical protein [Candidatus Paceibacterota bacterium]